MSLHAPVVMRCLPLFRPSRHRASPVFQADTDTLTCPCVALNFTTRSRESVHFCAPSRLARRSPVVFLVRECWFRRDVGARLFLLWKECAFLCQNGHLWLRRFVWPHIEHGSVCFLLGGASGRTPDSLAAGKTHELMIWHAATAARCAIDMRHFCKA